MGTLVIVSHRCGLIYWAQRLVDIIICTFLPGDVGDVGGGGRGVGLLRFLSGGVRFQDRKKIPG